MKYQVYFTTSLESLVDEVFVFEADAIEDILPRLSALVGKAPYWRWLFQPTGAFIDFGSWSRFLCITNATMEDCFSV